MITPFDDNTLMIKQMIPILPKFDITLIVVLISVKFLILPRVQQVISHYWIPSLFFFHSFVIISVNVLCRIILYLNFRCPVIYERDFALSASRRPRNGSEGESPDRGRYTHIEIVLLCVDWKAFVTHCGTRILPFPEEEATIG